jgi:hypothetical protein
MAVWRRTDLLNINITTEMPKVLERVVDFRESQERTEAA